MIDLPVFAKKLQKRSGDGVKVVLDPFADLGCIQMVGQLWEGGPGTVVLRIQINEFYGCSSEEEALGVVEDAIRFAMDLPSVAEGPPKEMVKEIMEQGWVKTEEAARDWITFSVVYPPEEKEAVA